MPQVVRTIDELRQCVDAAKAVGKRVGVVPTMGALHEGHLSLVRSSKAETEFTVVSIFVNPTQFGPNEDFERYPRALERDLALLGPLGVDLVFAPSKEEMYPSGHATYVEVDELTRRWEGAVRPGHFRGVATIVLKLFNAAEPDVAFFGQKDYQQCAVIQRMARDLDLPIDVRICPTVRDADGLALSSRNAYLSPDERQRGLSLSKSLRRAEELVAQGERSAQTILDSMRQVLEAGRVEIDYVALVDPETLEPVDRVAPGTVALVAARVGSTRLIDNTILDPL